MPTPQTSSTVVAGAPSIETSIVPVTFAPNVRTSNCSAVSPAGTGCGVASVTEDSSRGGVVTATSVNPMDGTPSHSARSRNT